MVAPFRMPQEIVERINHVREGPDLFRAAVEGHQSNFADRTAEQAFEHGVERAVVLKLADSRSPSLHEDHHRERLIPGLLNRYTLLGPVVEESKAACVEICN